MKKADTDKTVLVHTRPVREVPPPDETFEQMVARVSALPSLLEEISPEAWEDFIREAVKHPEVAGSLPKEPLQKRRGPA